MLILMLIMFRHKMLVLTLWYDIRQVRRLSRNRFYFRQSKDNISYFLWWSSFKTSNSIKTKLSRSTNTINIHLLRINIFIFNMSINTTRRNIQYSSLPRYNPFTIISIIFTFLMLLLYFQIVKTQSHFILHHQ